MRLVSTSLVLLAAAAATSVQAATAKAYPACSSQQSTQYFSALSNEIAQCQKSSTFDLAGDALPSTTQRTAVCKCSALLQKLPNTRVPRCKITLDGNAYKFKDAIDSIFAECSGVSVLEEPLPASQAGSEDGETGGEADAPTATATTSPPTNQTSSSSSSSSDDDTSAGSIDEVPSTTTPKPTMAATTTEPPAAVPTPAPTKSDAVTTAALTAATLTTTVAAMLLA